MKGRAIGAFFVVGALCACYFLLEGSLFAPFIVVCLTIGLCEIHTTMELYPCNFRSDYRFRASVPIECGIFIFAIPCAIFAGHKLAALAVAACCVSDTAAFTFGSLFGKHNRVKCLADISPKKSWAGFIAGAILPIPAVIGLAHWMGIFETENRITIICFACIAGLVAEIGDLIESAAKRTLQVKDSGDALAITFPFGFVELPLRGHGGYLDRFDSSALSIMTLSVLRAIIAKT